MYILVNKRPLNALNLEVSDIIKFDQNRLDQMHFIGSYDSMIIEAAKEAGLCKTETIYVQDGGYPLAREERICIKESYFFTVRDSNYYICSKFYETQIAEEEARDKLLLMANKIIARLYKVEI